MRSASFKQACLFAIDEIVAAITLLDQTNRYIYCSCKLSA